MSDQGSMASRAGLAHRLKEYRAARSLSVQALADRLDAPAYTVRRWEAGAARPTREQADQLSGLGLGPIADDETNKGTRSRIKVSGVAPVATVSQTLGLESLQFGSATVPPWILNGPPDQHEFQKQMLELQLESETRLNPLHLSMIQDYLPGERTAQSLLEAPKPTAASWNSNYGSHGWHRYVGRFPPHVVRSLLNHFGATQSSVVCDPFSGSGTTAVECRLLGVPFIGVEIGALSHLMGVVKASFRTTPGELLRVAADFERSYRAGFDSFVALRGEGYQVKDVLSRPGNPVPAFANIEKWFTAQAFLGVSLTVEYARTLDVDNRHAILLALSSKMRSIGNVDVDVVRAEYSRTPRQNVDVCALVCARLKKMNADIAAMVKTHPKLGDASSINLIEGSALSVDIAEASVDCVITSPPYGVEALSYLRTHLLSYRSLASELKHDPYETRDQTIGSEYLEESVLPERLAVAGASPTFCQFFSGDDKDITDKKTRQRRAGMMQFFEDMHRLGQRMAHWLKDDGGVAFVVGNKRLGDEIIPTDKIVIEVFADADLHCYRQINHKLKTNNSNSQVPWQERIIQEEAILLFRRKPRL